MRHTKRVNRVHVLHRRGEIALLPLSWRSEPRRSGVSAPHLSWSAGTPGARPQAPGGPDARNVEAGETAKLQARAPWCGRSDRHSVPQRSGASRRRDGRRLLTGRRQRHTFRTRRAAPGAHRARGLQRGAADSIWSSRRADGRTSVGALGALEIASSWTGEGGAPGPVGNVAQASEEEAGWRPPRNR